MTQATCNGGVHEDGRWLHCALARNHDGDCHMVEEKQAEPLNPAELVGAVVRSTKTTTKHLTG